MATKARRRPPAAPGLSAQQTEGLLGYELIREGLAKLESLPKSGQTDSLDWARGVYPDESKIWDAVAVWLED